MGLDNEFLDMTPKVRAPKLKINVGLLKTKNYILIFLMLWLVPYGLSLIELLITTILALDF